MVDIRANDSFPRELFIYWVPQFSALDDKLPDALKVNHFVPVELETSAQPAQLEIVLPNGLQINGVTERMNAPAIHIIAQL